MMEIDPKVDFIFKLIFGNEDIDFQEDINE